MRDKVLINGLFLNDDQSGGVHRTAQYLVHTFSRINNLTYDIDVLVSSQSDASVSTGRHVKIKSTQWNTRHPFKRIILENLYLPYLTSKGKYKLYHSLNYALPYYLPVQAVVTIHDVISIHFPEFCKQGSATYHKLFMEHSVKKAEKIIAVSHRVKEDLLRTFPINENKIEVIYHGIRPYFKRITDETRLKEIRLKHNLPERFILFVGNIEPKKNLTKLIEAFALLKQKTRFDHKLILIGGKSWKYESVFQSIKNSKVKKDIILPGFIPDDELPEFYTLADVFVFPSLYEGFGLPPLEAMACGTPVVCSNAGSLPEVTGSNCVLVDPCNANEIMSGVESILSNNVLKDRFIECGLKWSENFSWDETASQTLKVYNSLL